jgi:hypothetical protein
MGFSLNYVTPSTGAVATYHEVSDINLNGSLKKTTATVSSYLDKASKDAGKFAMYLQQIVMDGLPVAEPFAAAESQVIAAVPAGVTPDGSNRYVFAGATPYVTPAATA